MTNYSINNITTAFFKVRTQSIEHNGAKIIFPSSQSKFNLTEKS